MLPTYLYTIDSCLPIYRISWLELHYYYRDDIGVVVG
jgi:hypothetical protein